MEAKEEDKVGFRCCNSHKVQRFDVKVHYIGHFKGQVCFDGLTFGANKKEIVTFEQQFQNSKQNTIKTDLKKVEKTLSRFLAFLVLALAVAFPGLCVSDST